MVELQGVVDVSAVGRDEWDALCVVGSSAEAVAGMLRSAGTVAVAEAIEQYARVDAGQAAAWSAFPSEAGEAVVVPCAQAAGGRVVVCLVGPLGHPMDDVRVFYSAGMRVARRAARAGATRPLLWLLADAPRNALDVLVLGALQHAYVDIEHREHTRTQKHAFDAIAFARAPHALSDADARALAAYVGAVEAGRVVARDIGGADPERMTAFAIAEYLRATFQDHPEIRFSLVNDPAVLKKEYPLLHAVARASLQGSPPSLDESSFEVPRHHPAVVRLDYVSPDQSLVKDNLFFVGKGITYDTGGADVKTNGAMRGMSRDKCGAAAVAGFMLTIAKTKPKHLNATAFLGLVRNSIGPESYVSDEIILSRSGARVLVGNTDAEGRMVMADLLAHAHELALSSSSSSSTKPTSRLFTVATLTGHVIRAYGPYPACIDLIPSVPFSQYLSQNGLAWGDPWEISTLKREDFDMVRPKSCREDVVQCNTAPSTMTPRGHQFPMAFLVVAGGLLERARKKELEQGSGSVGMWQYTHMDISGAAEEEGSGSGSLPKCTGAPIVSWSAMFLKK